MSILKWLDMYIEAVLAIFLTGAMLLMLFFQVLSRYMLNVSLAWSEELSMFCLIWLCYVGAAIAVRKRQHLRITLLVDGFSAHKRLWVDVISNICFLGFIVYLFIGSADMMSIAYSTKQSAAATGFPRWIAILGLPFSFGLIAWRLVQDTVRLFQEHGQDIQGSSDAANSGGGQ